MRKAIAALIVMAVFTTAFANEAQAEWRWGIGLGGGYETGGKVFRAETDQTSPPPRWPLPGGGTTIDDTVAGAEIRAELDGFASFGVRATFVNSRGYGAIVSATLADLDMPVIRRSVSQNNDKVPWDQLFIVNVQAVGTWSLIPKGSTPYLLGGLGLVSFNSEGDALDQTSPALVIGGGYRWWPSRNLMVDIEVRDAIVSPNTDDEEARLSEALPIQFDAQGSVHLVDVQASVSLMF